MTEDTLVAALREICDVPGRRVALGIGDDAAAWQPSRSHLSVITTDALVEGVHFTLASMSAADIGYRALASNLSDIAAMGARPVLATIALGLSRAVDEAWIRAFYAEMVALASRSQTAIVGGDIVRAPAVMISITVVGEVRASSLKRRSGARPGDAIAVTGPLGASRAGLAIALERPELGADPQFADALAAFRRPSARLAEGRWLGASGSVRAMMDTSDGLSTDLVRLAHASGVGARVTNVPVAPAAERVAAAVDGDARAYALDGGEDFELLVTIDRRAFAYLAGRFAKRFGRPLVRIGTIEAESGVRLGEGAAETALVSAGFDHLR